MTENKETNKNKITRNDVILISVLIAIMITAILVFPITLDQAFGSLKDRINNAKTCSDVFNADLVPIGASSMVQMFDTNNSIKNLLDSKAHQLCKPLYDLQKKYGDLKLSDISKMSCDDLGILIHTLPARQEVINQYVSQCQIGKISKMEQVK